MKQLFTIVISVLFISNCSMIGAGTGALIDASYKNKNDKITSYNQKIRLEFVDGRQIRVRFRGLVYSKSPVNANSELTNKENDNSREESLPAFGEKVEFFIEDDSLNNIEGIFAGLLKQKNEYLFVINDADSLYEQYLPLTEVSKIKIGNGNYLGSDTNPKTINLLYEYDDIIYQAPLDILNHINLRKSNNMLVLGSVGLAIDLASVIITLTSINNGFQGL